MDSTTKEFGERIEQLLELVATAKGSLAELGERDTPQTALRRANLQATITMVQRELAQSLQGAGDLDAVTETLTELKEGRLAARSGQTRAPGAEGIGLPLPFKRY